MIPANRYTQLRECCIAKLHFKGLVTGDLMLRQYRLCLFLIGFSMVATDAVAVEFKRLDAKAPHELFYENAVINGQIGQSLVVTNNSGDIEIVDTRNGSVTATFELSDQQQVVNVKSSPGSSAGLN